MRIAGILQELLAIGRSADIWAVERLDIAGRSREVIKFSADFRGIWSKVVDWDASDRLALSKAAAALEHTVGGIGSVTVLDLLLRNLPKAAEKEALDWVLANTTSYAYYSHGAKSWLEFKTVSEQIAAARTARRAATAAAEMERAETAKASRAIRATHNLANAVRRGDKIAVVALLSSGASSETLAPDGSDLVEYAIRLERHEIAELLVRARVAKLGTAASGEP